MGVIYKATCLDNNKTYIGQTTKDLSQRRHEHEKATDDYPFHCAIRKHGANRFSWEIIEECQNHELDKKEIYWIDYYRSYVGWEDSWGYNATIGGDNASALESWRKTHKDQAREYALQAIARAQQYNREHSEEHMAQLARARINGIKARSKKVCCIDLDLIFDSLSDAEKWSQTEQNPNGRHCSHQHISKVCRGKRKTAGGYKWKYV